MVKMTRLMLALIALTFAGTAAAALPAAVDGQPVPSLAPLVERTAPAVVNIRVSQTVSSRAFGDEAFRRFFGIPDMPDQGSRRVSSAGSGVIVDANLVAKNRNHQITDAAGLERVLEPLLGTDVLVAVEVNACLVAAQGAGFGNIVQQRS